MAVDRLSVTVSSELGAALRGLAKVRGETVSTVVAAAIAHEVRLSTLDLALAEAERRHGRVPDALVAEAEGELLAALKRGRRRARTRSSR
jgi:predicted transcriptional regulator